MKKLIDFIKVKNRESNIPTPEKKADAKKKKSKSSGSSEDTEHQPNDLFWDDYSDIGYC